MGIAVRDAIQQVSAWGTANGHILRELETTLTVALVPVRAARVSSATLAWVGDSPAFLGRDRSWHPLTGSDYAETITSSATRGALTSGPDHLTVRTVPMQPGDRLLLCSDGIGAFIGDAERPLALGIHLAESLATPQSLDEVVRQVAFDLRTADDDRSMIIIWKAPLATLDGQR